VNSSIGVRSPCEYAAKLVQLVRRLLNFALAAIDEISNHATGV
jgi:hypothetical protein